jgi:hypothetical protein
MLILSCVLSSGVAVAGTLTAPVAIKSVTAPSESKEKDDPISKVLTSTDGHWCQAKRGLGPGEPLNITFAAPSAISAVELDTSNDGNTIASAEVTLRTASYSRRQRSTSSSARIRPVTRPRS